MDVVIVRELSRVNFICGWKELSFCGTVGMSDGLASKSVSST